MSEYTVTVLGATGKTGRHVTRYAADRGWRVRAAGRRQASSEVHLVTLLLRHRSNSWLKASLVTKFTLVMSTFTLPLTRSSR